MELSELLNRLAGRQQAVELQPQVEDLLRWLPASAPADWRRLAACLAVLLPDEQQGPHVLGISGGQGAGKSTLAALLVLAATHRGRRPVALSLDDFYLTRSERADLARSVHPLLATRGVPGTHDVALACSVIDGIESGAPCSIPIFDKATDDRQPQVRHLTGPTDLLILEGWCVGATPQPQTALVPPVNELERVEDADAIWRRYVNDQLAGCYADLWSRLDRLLFLQVPDIAAVIRWRTQQEQAHPEARRMSAAAIERFVAHYERLTRWMMSSVSRRAELVGLLDENHDLADLIVRDS